MIADEGELRTPPRGGAGAQGGEGGKDDLDDQEESGEENEDLKGPFKSLSRTVHLDATWCVGSQRIARLRNQQPCIDCCDGTNGGIRSRGVATSQASNNLHIIYT